ncbi:4Fe-4S dicluster domain-containing protein [Thermomicrobium roseum]|uniref:4Fe-4S ferredoxin iron-sulfur binding domain protein n=1 Tax=Thermomicrobium roseum (strain ATCC 27502 / DSM 5159 / P-2) TaxID=309801 RepID=B9L4B5_THERP|nr:4Fe-4S dicluster domain-containing protein [Thermomicrobium roseum]ACM06967.1 4Fe-4S ferredoxin iron-sulfur binding domain protein [Thermomicrobium roseum DSM 5159]
MARYGFVIDQRKCIGCHACTVACKSENLVPLGVYRTWVKYVEKGTFPHTRRSFTVLRCNHCDDAPCVTICPTKALFRRPDGIVDFDADRCIGCKSCMQACPYDALYIDPITRTAAKCNYCSHRVDQGLLPACVVVCPEKAIIAGDLDDPTSEIHQLVAREPVMVRKPEQGTRPKLFYLGADEASLTPEVQTRTNGYLWAEVRPDDRPAEAVRGTEYLPGPADARVAYDVWHPKPWGWKVASYLWTKSIGSGALALGGPLLASGVMSDRLLGIGAAAIGMVFLAITAVLLIWDLKRPERFWYLLVKPNPRSWLVWGGYILLVVGGLAFFWAVASLAGWQGIERLLAWLALPGGIAAAGYTAFLFGQAEGRDFWQSPLLLPILLVQALVAGTAALLLLLVAGGALEGRAWLGLVLGGGLIGLLVLVASELLVPHANLHVAKAARLLTHGPYRGELLVVGLGVGVLVPLIALALGWASGNLAPWSVVAAVAALIGLWSYERLWVEAGQDIPLS